MFRPSSTAILKPQLLEGGKRPYKSLMLDAGGEFILQLGFFCLGSFGLSSLAWQSAARKDVVNYNAAIAACARAAQWQSALGLLGAMMVTKGALTMP